MQTLNKTKPRVKDAVVYGLICLSASVSILLLVGITGYVLYRGLSQISWSFLTTVPSTLKGTFGIAGNLVNTLYIVILTLLFAVPVGIGSAIWLNEYAKPGKLVRLIEFTTETLSGIPSIIFGLFGMVFFGTGLKLGYSILTGALTLTLMILPLITRNTQEALKTVPDSYRHGAMGLGAGKWHTIHTILLPSAMPGILTGVLLSVGRIVGESAALLFTAGSGALLPRFLPADHFFEGIGSAAGTLFHKIFESSGTLTIQLYLSMSKAQYDEAFGIAVVLLVFVFLMNLLTRRLAGRLDVTKKK